MLFNNTLGAAFWFRVPTQYTEVTLLGQGSNAARSTEGGCVAPARLAYGLAKGSSVPHTFQRELVLHF